MKKKFFIPIATFIVVAFFAYGCNNATPAKEATANADSTSASVTNPNLSIASTEYSDLSEKSIQLLAKGDYDAWANMLADDIVYAYPDGDMNTRTKITGKAALLAWWKKSKESGMDTMMVSEFNHTPINSTGQLKAGAPTGIYDIVYFTSKMIIKGKPVSIRMNFSVHFNADKKIDRYYTYYDRSAIINATGKNTLDEGRKK
ncbi:MAG: nuclear transport factor 2 family protein [Bacteroidetes bacterium]|nr:nuclear transport factor 2 family protein [Bacteroidota bacterium]